MLSHVRNIERLRTSLRAARWSYFQAEATYEEVHSEIADLVDSDCDLTDYLEAFFRVIPGNKRFTKTVFRLRKWDIHDDVISTLNRMKVRAPLKRYPRS